MDSTSFGEYLYVGWFFFLENGTEELIVIHIKYINRCQQMCKRGYLWPWGLDPPICKRWGEKVLEVGPPAQALG
jgi:hypothetical protein